MAKSESKTRKPAKPKAAAAKSAAAKSATAKAAAAKPAAAKPKPLPVDEAILAALGRDAARTLSAPEIAHVIAPEGDWHALLMPIRRAAVALAVDGRLVIYRKGKPVEDPTDFRGVYRLGLPTAE